VPACCLSYFKEDKFSQSRGSISCTKIASYFSKRSRSCCSSQKLRTWSLSYSETPDTRHQSFTACTPRFFQKHDLLRLREGWLTHAAAVCRHADAGTSSEVGGSQRAWSLAKRRHLRGFDQIETEPYCSKRFVVKYIPSFGGFLAQP
jgi:hypothetical protein